MLHKLSVGDRVKYRRGFLQSIGVYTGHLAFARGVVKKLVPLGTLVLAEVDWGLDAEATPSRVNVNNLALASVPEEI